MSKYCTEVLELKANFYAFVHMHMARNKTFNMTTEEIILIQ